jgi:hypothetical protein
MYIWIVDSVSQHERSQLIVLVNKNAFRVIGGILPGLGMVASAFTRSVEMLFLTYGVILGMLYC